MVAISYGKGITLCEEYKEQLNGESFASFIRKKFPSCFKKSNCPTKKLFLQDGDPSQNSRAAKKAIEEVGGKKFPIPPRSPDLNPIENVFNLVRRKLATDAIEKEITRETYERFVCRVKETMYSIDLETINRTIASMDKRIKEVLQSKGQRSKY